VALRLVTAVERLAESERKVSIVVVGRAKVGKTSLLVGLPSDSTLVLDFEAGLKSVEGRWDGDSVTLRSWLDAINIICLIAGADPARPADQTFSVAHHAYCVETFGKFVEPAKYRTIFVDSITDLTRVAMAWAQLQPAAFSERGRPDLRGAYGLLGREVVAVLKHLQHAPGKNVVFVGGLDRRLDDFGREIYELQTEGLKVGSELPYIVDELVTMSDFDYDAATDTWSHNFGKGEYRAFCCRSPNPWGLPAGDRSGRLGQIEQPHLGRLIEKINGTIPSKEQAT
jgi:hypothetical protein